MLVSSRDWSPWKDGFIRHPSSPGGWKSWAALCFITLWPLSSVWSWGSRAGELFWENEIPFPKAVWDPFTRREPCCQCPKHTLGETTSRHWPQTSTGPWVRFTLWVPPATPAAGAQGTRSVAAQAAWNPAGCSCRQLRALQLQTVATLPACCSPPAGETQQPAATQPKVTSVPRALSHHAKSI